MKAFLIAFLIVFLQLALADVSMSNLAFFWENTYDHNKDGFATISEFAEYFRLMEPEHNVNEQDIAPIFSFFDADLDYRVTLKELIEVSRVKVTTQPGPKQIHIGFTDQEDEMQVMWVTTPELYNQPIVEYGRLPGVMTQKAEGTWITYNVGHLGFHGRIYRVVLKGLEPLKRYYYRVGDK
jgi:hypothetical protein